MRGTPSADGGPAARRQSAPLLRAGGARCSWVRETVCSSYPHRGRVTGVVDKRSSHRREPETARRQGHLFLGCPGGTMARSLPKPVRIGPLDALRAMTGDPLDIMKRAVQEHGELVPVIGPLGPIVV